MGYYFLHRGLQRMDPFFSNTQQIYRSRVLLEVEMRYANVLAWKGVQKLLIFSGWHSSHQNRDMHYTLRGYNREGWMVVMLEMKAGNAGGGYSMHVGMGVRWHQDTFSELGSM
ncbi:hypothetical protein EDD18DRAFT_1107297 [Armillaria luteobubalina]|uniref:Uncharacterized protein n=1 Tax=Armillaria luteobubalina TaxID=153913 RepID=A0AA39Q104_9AGAR|nr:hypothetical protein EDD18DRAFT_1107297 [Armillaria luteobubalina]